MTFQNEVKTHKFLSDPTYAANWGTTNDANEATDGTDLNGLMFGDI